MFFWWVEQIILPKNIFLPHFEIVQNFHYFERFRACRFSAKNSIFQKLPQMLKKCFFWWVEQIILPKNIFLPHFEIVQNFHYFVRVRLSIFHQKFNFPKTASNVVEMFLLMSGTNSFAKNISLPHFEILHNFHYFVRSTSVDFLSKIQFSKNCLKYYRNVSFYEWNK